LQVPLLSQTVVQQFPSWVQIPSLPLRSWQRLQTVPGLQVVALWLGSHTWQASVGLAAPLATEPASTMSQLVAWLVLLPPLLLPPEELLLLLLPLPELLEDVPADPPPEQAKAPVRSSVNVSVLAL
jgi:hypothetical protein